MFERTTRVVHVPPIYIQEKVHPRRKSLHLHSQDMTLEPGDVIACGTSLGVLPMKPGSVVEVHIEGIGTLRSTYSVAGTA